ncbi:MAG: hypothetical protein ACK55I_17235, partial [bacterium]
MRPQREQHADRNDGQLRAPMTQAAGGARPRPESLLEHPLRLPRFLLLSLGKIPQWGGGLGRPGLRRGLASAVARLLSVSARSDHIFATQCMF